MIEIASRLENAFNYADDSIVMPREFGGGASDSKKKVWVRFDQTNDGLDVHIGNQYSADTAFEPEDKSPPFLGPLGGRVSVRGIHRGQRKALYVATVTIPWLDTVINRNR